MDSAPQKFSFALLCIFTDKYTEHLTSEYLADDDVQSLCKIIIGLKISFGSAFEEREYISDALQLTLSSHPYEENRVLAEVKGYSCEISNGSLTSDGQQSLILDDSLTDKYSDSDYELITDSGHTQNSKESSFASMESSEKEISDQNTQLYISENAPIKCNDSNGCEDSVQRGEVSIQRGEVSIQRGEVSVQRGDDSVQRGDDSVQRGDVSDDVGDVSDDVGEVSDDVGEDSDDVGEDSEDGGEDSEDGGEDSDDGGEDSEDGGEDSEDGGEDSEDGGEDSEDGGEDSEDGGEDSEDGGEDSEDGGEDSEDARKSKIKARKDGDQLYMQQIAQIPGRDAIPGLEDAIPGFDAKEKYIKYMLFNYCEDLETVRQILQKTATRCPCCDTYCYTYVVGLILIL
ncbi:hypothetical protein CDAR_598801 [Caerostris darwini]|uniref:Uncharacterized protein n=1 Tax=Caerostris darwini TaxID=1538125 RepID=A0AAV4R4Z9_9ARAC|nr:hypothetical protein CDAR_598801 [Caerostris darwini]